MPNPENVHKIDDCERLACMIRDSCEASLIKSEGPLCAVKSDMIMDMLEESMNAC